MHPDVYARKLQTPSRENIVATVEEFFSLLPITATLTPNSNVLIKPNLLAKHAPDKAVTTHPDILFATITALQKRGVTKITVADSPGGKYSPATMQAIYKVCGIQQVCDETGVTAYTECKSRTTQTQGKLVRSFEILEPALDADFIINLPKLKTHVMTGMSGAVKNLFGCVPGLQKAEFHMRFPQKELFGQMLVDLCETLKPSLHIVDGIIAMEGDGPAGGVPRPTGLLIAGENPYNIDLAICRYISLPPMAVPFLQAANKQGLCSDVFDTALLQADANATQPLENFALPKSHNNINFDQSVPAFLRPIIPAFTKMLSPKPRINKNLCVGCAKCAEICPQQVITIQNYKAVINYKDCIHCFCCHEMCPVKAIDVKRIPLFNI